MDRAEVHAVVLAGGQGKGFWPLASSRRPKQLLRLFDDSTLIEATIKRLTPTFGADRLHIVTLESQADDVLDQLDAVSRDQLICEPFAKNTAPAIGLAAVHLYKQSKTSMMVVLPADHRIEERDLFEKAMNRAIEFVDESDAIVTIGIEPTRPEPSYGYIQFEGDAFRPGIHRVITFAEKPDREIARRFIQTGEFLWNSGIYVWSCERILSEIEEHLPELFAALMEIYDALDTPQQQEKTLLAYQSIRPISIDYGVMEKAPGAYVVPGRFTWSDVGDWSTVYRMQQHDEQGNALHGRVVTLEANNVYAQSTTGQRIAVVGVDNVIVVETSEGLLICHRDQVQDVGRAADLLEKLNGQRDE